MVDRDEELVARVARHELLAEFRVEARAKLATIENRLSGLEMTFGRMEERQIDRGQRLERMERILDGLSKSSSGPASTWLTWERLLIAAFLLGMALTKLGIDPKVLGG
jgi:hypothetical protein